MKNVLPLALLLIAIVIALVVYLGDGDETGEYDAAPTTNSPVTAPPSELEGLKGRAPDEIEKARDNTHLLKRYKTRYGSLEILPIGPDGNTVPPEGLTVHVEPLGRSHRIGKPLGFRDMETHLWTYRKIPIGDVKIRVFGDFVIPTEDSTKVREGIRTHKKVFVEIAGSIKYDVKLYDGTQPENVKLKLFDMRGKAVSAVYQVRTREHTTTAREATEVTQKPFGYIFGIRPGTYQLRVTSPEDETETVTIDVERQKETVVEIEVRR